MIRLAAAIGVRPERIAEYERLHAAVWPEVLDRLRRSGMTNYSIFRLGETLFSYLEYTGSDLAADQAAIAADPATKDWWALCMPMQRPLPDRTADEWWAGMHETFHMD